MQVADFSQLTVGNIINDPAGRLFRIITSCPHDDRPFFIATALDGSTSTTASDAAMWEFAYDALPGGETEAEG